MTKKLESAGGRLPPSAVMFMCKKLPGSNVLYFDKEAMSVEEKAEEPCQEEVSATEGSSHPLQRKHESEGAGKESLGNGTEIYQIGNNIDEKSIGANDEQERAPTATRADIAQEVEEAQKYCSDAGS